MAIGVRFSSDAALAKARESIEPLLSDEKATAYIADILTGSASAPVLQGQLSGTDPAGR